MNHSGTNAFVHANDESVILPGFSKGAVIYRQDDPAQYWFEVISGMIRTSHLFRDGRRQLTGFFCSGDVFGVEQGLYKTSAEVVTDCAKIRRVCWGNATEDDHGRERALQCAESSIILLGHRTAPARVAAFLLDLRTRTGADRQVAVPMPRSDIADYLGLTMETVSRTFGQLARRGLITLADPHMAGITDLNGLRETAGDSIAGVLPDRNERDRDEKLQ